MDSVSFQVIGCGDAFASGGLFNTCFYLRGGNWNILIDCGASSLVALKKQGINPLEIDLIAVTHFHGDHYGGIPFMILDGSVRAKRDKPLTIVLPPGGSERLSRLMEALYPGTAGLLDGPLYIIREFSSTKPIDFSSVHQEDLQLEFFEMVHSPPALPHGVRVSLQDKVISYSGDSEWNDNIISLAEQADLLVLECYAFDTPMKAHLDYTTILDHLPELNARKIMLTHFGDQMLDNQEKLSLECLEEGKIYPV